MSGLSNRLRAQFGALLALTTLGRCAPASEWPTTSNRVKQTQPTFLILYPLLLCFAPNLAPPNFPLFSHFAAPWGVAPLVSDKIGRLALLPVQLFAAGNYVTHSVRTWDDLLDYVI